MAFYTFQPSRIIGLISMDNFTIPKTTIVAMGDAPMAVAYDIKQKVRICRFTVYLVEKKQYKYIYIKSTIIAVAKNISQTNYYKIPVYRHLICIAR